ncbi:hypothetical protein ICA16_23035 [Pseudomonas anatoliensis]|uniref:hypothetical protein n=1 Tax=Pseudomonas anatoliensis TaxID=2710589 RepID=UPI001B33E217|nr:hypothetical protein [Pseudomonas anatoliensis]MBP5958552.1 hypothetical protein [Pseudomonas anatoliensis]
MNGKQGWLSKIANMPYKWFEELVLPGEEDGVKKLYRVFIFALAVIFVTFFFDISIAFYKRESGFDHGVFGDFFGGVTNPILTFFAFVGLLITITIQRVELKESRAELAKSAAALELQSEYFRLQNAVATFYKMVDTHISTLSAIDLVDKDHHVTRGRDCMRVFCHRLTQHFKNCTQPPASGIGQVKGNFISVLPSRDSPKGAVSAFMSFWEKDGEELQQYMAGIHISLSYIDGSLNGEDLYVGMYKSLFSDSERVLVFYYAIAVGNVDFRELLVKYSFCTGIPQHKLLNQIHVLGLPLLSL